MKRHFFLYYILLLAIQLLICEWFNFSAYVTLSILPVMVLCIPTKHNTLSSMFIAFASGLAIDFLAEGVMGMNALALVPVATVRLVIIGIIFGNEPILRQSGFSVRKNGFGKVLFTVVLVQSLYLAIYLFADGALLRPVLFNVERFLASLVAGVFFSMFIVNLLTSKDRR